MDQAHMLRRLLRRIAAETAVREGTREREARHGSVEMNQQSEVVDRGAAQADRALKAAQRAMWAAGDYHRFALATVWPLGPVLVRAAGIGPGQRVLDAACGSGNVAVRAAQAGARVTAADLTPENFEGGRRAAREAGVAVEWTEADVESLPFEDASFDVVTSCLGAMFAPHHARVASEMLRVCRPGGTVAMINFTPEGLAGEFFGMLAPWLPPLPEGAQPPLLWGSEDHVRAQFGDRVGSLDLCRDTYAERAESPREYAQLFRQTFGPVVSLYASLADDPQRLAVLDRELEAYAMQANRGARGAAAEYPYEYLLVLARK